MTVSTIHTTQKNLRGPWLLDHAALAEVDDLFAQYTQLRAARHERDVEDRVAGELERRHNQSDEDDATRRIRVETRVRENFRPPRMTVAVALGAEKKVIGDSLREVQSAPTLLSEAPTAFSMVTEASPDWSVSIAKLDINGSGVSISVPDNDEDARVLFGQVYQWALKHESPWPLQFWGEWGFLFVLVFAMSAATFLLASVPTRSNAVFEREAHEIVRQGVSAENRDRALVVALALLSDYSDSRNAPRFGMRAFLIGLVSSILAVILAFPPRLVLGLGIGQRKLTMWQRWLQFLFVFVPTSIVLPVALSYLTDRF